MPSTIKIGCDPEFTLLDQHGSHRNFDMFEHVGRHGTVKSDHGGAVGEFNPSASDHPHDVVENLRHLILKVHEHYPNYKVVAGGGKEYQISTGGHIHLSGIDTSDIGAHDYSWGSRYRSNRLTPMTPGNKLILTFDGFIGSRLQKLKNGKRSDSAYNQLSAVRRQDYTGGIRGIEYRSAPSFLTTPQLAEATLATAMYITKLWKVKPNCFDTFLSKRSTIDAGHRWKKVIAKRQDFLELMPTDNDEEARYFKTQIRFFMDIALNRAFDLGNTNLIQFWTAPVAAPVAVPRTSVTVTRRISRADRRIVLQPCQLKIARGDDNFSSEHVERVVRFAVSEVRIYPIAGQFVPWHFRFIRDQILKANTIYISKDLRKFIKMKRGLRFKLRFIDMRIRQASTSAPNTLSQSIFFDSTSVPLREVYQIFDECVRSKLRRSDAVAA